MHLIEKIENRLQEKKFSLRVLILMILFFLIFSFHFAYLATKSKTINKLVQYPKVIKSIFIPNTQDLIAMQNRFEDRKKFTTNNQYNFENFLLISRYDGDLKRSIVELIDLDKKEIIHTWLPDIKKINKKSKLNRKIFNLERDKNINRQIIRHPILLKNGSLIFTGNGYPLVNIDKCSKLIWMSDYPFHHSIETDHKGNYWSTFLKYPGLVTNGSDENIGLETNIFRDDFIANISKDGQILFEKSLMQIFIENNLGHLIFPGEAIPSFDPFHVNDVEPVLKNTKFFKKGDLFISLRNNSTVFQYRPSTNEIIWIKKYPWVYQHDVDIINDTQISIFNNKNLQHYARIVGDKPKQMFNDVNIYDFEKDEVTSPYKNYFKKFDVRTPMQGLSQIYKDNIFIEETNFGRLLYFNNNGELLFEYINRAKDNNVYTLNWSRLINKAEFENTFEILNNSKCN